MSADPSFSAVTLTPGATEKIEVSDVDHAASFVTFTEAPALIMAVAVNCAVSPTTIRLFGAPRIFSDLAAPEAPPPGGGAAGGDEDDPHPTMSVAVTTAAVAVMNFMCRSTA